MTDVEVNLSTNLEFYINFEEDLHKIPKMLKNLVKLAEFHLKYLYPDFNIKVNATEIITGSIEIITDGDDVIKQGILFEIQEITKNFFKKVLWQENAEIYRIYRKLMFTTISIHKYTRHQLNMEKSKFELRSLDELIKKLLKSKKGD